MITQDHLSELTAAAQIAITQAIELAPPPQEIKELVALLTLGGVDILATIVECQCRQALALERIANALENVHTSSQ